ncbi:hypothetical protein THRCLA_04655 [Thraustotheca clavata]|uniref:Uncharacterized protein n=1 Tax=Thraustotheca clavata TaxID=74557 RepID=A0A1V9ZZ21_9STRA|nr:hypothetical protein THRCLA_04655 [Thraustotheca clavata]
MPLSYPIIEARFQLLDASLAQMNRARYTRLNASDSLREMVKEHRKSNKRIQCGNARKNQRETNCNQIEARINNAQRPCNVQRPCKENIHRSLGITTPPDFPMWGQSMQKVCDKNEAQIHAAAQESWQTRVEKAKSAGYTRPTEADTNPSQGLIPQNESRVDLSKPTTEPWTHTGTLRIPERPPVRQSKSIQKPAPNRRIRCHSATTCSKVKRNWFDNEKPPQRCPVKPLIPSKPQEPKTSPTPPSTSPKVEPIPLNDSNEMDEPKVDDYHSEAFYHLEIRLEHSSSLSGWCFRVIIADITATDRPRILLSNMKCDENHCILFTNPSTKVTTTTFNPLEYFDHISKPIELYRHTLHIQVISELPVQKPIVDTYVHYTTGNDNEIPIDLEPLNLESEASTPPCSTLNNSAYVYANHFDLRYV